MGPRSMGTGRFILACVASVVALSVAAAGRAAAAASGEDDVGTEVSAPDARAPANDRAADAGAYLPLSLSPQVGAGGVAASAIGHAGYDAARKSAVSTTFAEVRVWGPLAIRGGAELSDASNRLRPTIGARVQLLAQQRHAVDGSVSVFYRAEGFSEPEGEIETVIAIGRQLGRTALIGNLAYGQDPEGRERDGEIRAAVLARFGRHVLAGVDGRWRFDLGSDRAKLRASNEPTFDLDAGPVGVLALGPMSILAHGGVSVVRRVGQDATAGLIALGGLGTSF